MKKDLRFHTEFIHKSMFITVAYGDAQTLLINTNCTAKVFTDFLREKCKVAEKAVIDLTDENASLAEIYVKEPQENVSQYFTPRGTYILVEVEMHEDNEDIKKITPMLNDWEKKYQFLERKLKHRDKKNKKAMESEATTSKQEALETPSRLNVRKSERGGSRTSANERGNSRTSSRKSSDKDRISESNAERTESPSLLAPPKKSTKQRRKSNVKNK